MEMHYFFIGIGGSGMSSIAQILRRRGNAVAGSDRSLDQGGNAKFFDQLKQTGIRLFPQDGSGITPEVDAVVASAAVEDTVPDMAKARSLGIPVARRAETLAELFNSSRGIAVGGTSGKSTTAGMAGWLLHSAGLDPTIINGAEMKNFERLNPPGNALPGKSDLMVIESDESDGTIALYTPAVAIISNIGKDHKPMPELRRLFHEFGLRATGAVVVNADCPEASALDFSGKNRVTFSIENDADARAEDIEMEPLGSSFTLGGQRFSIRLPGAHNVYNALAAIAAARAVGVEDSTSAEALAGFAGIRRRFDIVGEAGGVLVIDDFAHNPDKLRATFHALRPLDRRLLLVYQPHGFGPTAFLKDEFIEVFSAEMKPDDLLFMPEIFYAGGTAAKTISSADLISGIAGAGRNAEFIPSRKDIQTRLVEEARPGDAIVVMGARDPSLSTFCRHILNAL